MSIVTKKDFKRVHFNGTVLVDVPKGTALIITPYHAAGAWKVTDGEQVFHINRKEYKQLVGEIR